MTQARVQGVADDRFDGVRSQFQTHLDTGADIGASFCVTKDGETVVDLWGGFADIEGTRPWEKDTIVWPTGANWILMRLSRNTGRSLPRAERQT